MSAPNFRRVAKLQDVANVVGIRQEGYRGKYTREHGSIPLTLRS